MSRMVFVFIDLEPLLMVSTRPNKQTNGNGR